MFAGTHPDVPGKALPAFDLDRVGVDDPVIGIALDRAVRPVPAFLEATAAL
jgi:hypothetical protein